MVGPCWGSSWNSDSRSIHIDTSITCIASHIYNCCTSIGIDCSFYIFYRSTIKIISCSNIEISCSIIPANSFLSCIIKYDSSSDSIEFECSDSRRLGCSICKCSIRSLDFTCNVEFCSWSWGSDTDVSIIQNTHSLCTTCSIIIICGKCESST